MDYTLRYRKRSSILNADYCFVLRIQSVLVYVVQWLYWKWKQVFTGEIQTSKKKIISSFNDKKDELVAVFHSRYVNTYINSEHDTSDIWIVGKQPPFYQFRNGVSGEEERKSYTEINDNTSLPFFSYKYKAICIQKKDN